MTISNRKSVTRTTGSESLIIFGVSCDCLARDKMRMFAFSISRLSPRRLIESAKCALAFCLLKLRNYPVWAEGVKNSANNSDNNRRRCSKKVSVTTSCGKRRKKSLLKKIFYFVDGNIFLLIGKNFLANFYPWGFKIFNKILFKT